MDWASDTLITEYSGVFSKLKFACYKDDLYYCTVAYNQPTAAARRRCRHFGSVVALRHRFMRLIHLHKIEGC